MLVEGHIWPIGQGLEAPGLEQELLNCLYFCIILLKKEVGLDYFITTCYNMIPLHILFAGSILYLVGRPMSHDCACMPLHKTVVSQSLYTILWGGWYMFVR